MRETTNLSNSRHRRRKQQLRSHLARIPRRRRHLPPCLALPPLQARRARGLYQELHAPLHAVSARVEVLLVPTLLRQPGLVPLQCQSLPSLPS